MGLGRSLNIKAPSILRHGVFSLKTHQMVSVNTPEKFENTAMTGNSGFVSEENSGREIVKERLS